MLSACKQTSDDEIWEQWQSCPQESQAWHKSLSAAYSFTASKLKPHKAPALKKTRRKRSLRISFFDKFKVILHSVFNGIAILPTTRITNQFIHNETRHTSTLSVGMDRDRILPALFERIPVSPHIHSRRDQVLLMSCRRQPQGGTPHFRSVPRHR